MKALPFLLGLGVTLIVGLVVFHLDARPRTLRRVRQLTTEGTHAEAYYSQDGRKLILMAMRAGDAADQIYTLDLRSGGLEKVSTGKGKTTCGYFLKDGRILYSSTHHKGDAPPARPPRSAGYVWPMHQEFDIFVRQHDGALTQITREDGYDAEATLSPDGTRLVFTAHRDGRMGLWTMNIDGTDLEIVKHKEGYAGGAFFSPDGEWIVYRAFYPETEEDKKEHQLLLDQAILRPGKLFFNIYISRPDGSEERALTTGRDSNWAPCWHPDGRTIVFASNREAGRGEFSLWAVDIDGNNLRRLTPKGRFDSFPHFSPSGKNLIFISNLNGNDPRRDLNVFMADWDH